jgi:hypothetical protein
MSDWPAQASPFGGYPIIHPFGLNSLGGNSGGSLSGVASTVWPATNRIILVPFRIATPMLIVKMWFYNGGTASGNLDVGIYSVDGTKIVSAGSTAQTGTSTIQTIDTTDTMIGPGLFYIASVMDNTTGTNRAVIPNQLGFLATMGMATAVTDAFPLPATIAFLTITNVFVPSAGLSTRTTV